MNARTVAALGAWLVLAGLAMPDLWGQVRGQADDEAKLAEQLRSAATPPAQKDAVCRRLIQARTDQAVPALAELLVDETFSQMARAALEAMPFAEAGAALREALGKTTGLTKAGIIDSIGQRRDREAAADLAAILKGADREKDQAVACSAAVALGRIGGVEALAALRAALRDALRDALRAAAQPEGRAPSRPPGSAATQPGGADAGAAVRAAIADGLLICAEGLLSSGDAAAAATLYEELYRSDLPDHFRLAAHCGMIQAAMAADASDGKGARAVELLTDAFGGTDRPARMAALQMVSLVKGEQATWAVSALLAKVGPDIQLALLAALVDRGDRAVAGAILAVADSPDAAVRVAALSAVGVLGGPSEALPLARAAGSSDPQTQEAARQALVRLHGPNVAATMIARLADADPPVRVELIRALGRRGEAAAVPALLSTAAGADEPLRLAGLDALAGLADCLTGPDAEQLVKLLLACRSDRERAAVEKTLAAACRRAQDRPACQQAVLAAVDEPAAADASARCALLRVCGGLDGEPVLAALRRGLKDNEPAVRDAALRALASCADPQAVADLLALAKDADNLADRVLALRGCVRLANEAAGMPAERRVEILKAAADLARRPEEKKLVLAGLSRLASVAALKLAESLAADPAVGAEGQSACLAIAVSLPRGDPQAMAVLHRLAETAANPAVRDRALKAVQDAARASAAGVPRPADKPPSSGLDVPATSPAPGPGPSR